MRRCLLSGSAQLASVHSHSPTCRHLRVATVNGLRLTVYDNAAALIDHPLSRARAFVWQQFVERQYLIGSLSWWCAQDLSMFVSTVCIHRTLCLHDGPHSSLAGLTPTMRVARPLACPWSLHGSRMALMGTMLSTETARCSTIRGTRLIQRTRQFPCSPSGFARHSDGKTCSRCNYAYVNIALSLLHNNIVLITPCYCVWSHCAGSSRL